MTKVFINYSNHPMYKWSEEQLNAAKEISDTFQDIEFPQINPEATEDDIINLVKEQLGYILDINREMDDITIHIAGEMTFVAYFISYCNKWCKNVTCITSTSKRNTVENPDGSKTIKFEFVKFRRYITV